MGDDDLTQRAVLVDHVDDAVVGEARHQQVGEGVEGRVDVDRGGEDGAGLVHQPRPFLRRPLGRDVVDDVDHELDTARLGLDRRRADERPALLAVGQQPVAHDPLLLLPGGERTPPGERVRVERRAVLGDHREALHQLRGGQRDHLLARLEPQQACRGVVGVGERPVRALRRDPVGDVAEDDVELNRGDRRRGHGGSIARATDEVQLISVKPPQSASPGAKRPFRGLRASAYPRERIRALAPTNMGRVGIEPTTLGLRVPCSTS